MNNEEEPSSIVGPLREKINRWSRKHAAEFPPEVLKLFADKSEEVLKSGILEKSPAVGHKVPDFQLPSSEGAWIRLSEQVAPGPVILNFYRGSWCHYCTLEFQLLLERLPKFRSHGASVLAISPQVENPTRIPEEHGGGFINLSDRGNQVARSFGLVYPLGDALKKVYQGFGIRLDQFNGDDSYEVPVPASYIIDRDLTVRYAFASADLADRAEPDVLLREITALVG